MRRHLSQLFLAFALTARLPAADPAAAGPTAAGALAPVPADPWLASLTPLLVEHYQPTGDLVLAWARPRPATAPVSATLTLGNCPAELAPQLLVNIRATDAAGHVTEHTLVLRAELWRDGWTLHAPASIGDPVRPAQLDLRRFDALREHDILAADPALDLNFARNVTPGRLLTWHDVVRRPLVRRGQPVEVSASEGSLTVTLRALSLQDAARGETVRVRNLDTNREFTAVVTAEARATVSF